MTHLPTPATNRAVAEIGRPKIVAVPDVTPEPARAEGAVAELLDSFGIDLLAEDLRDTPRRVAEMYAELLTPEPFNLTTFANDALYDELVLVRDIPFVSLRAHHLLPFSGRAHVGYIPGERIVGLSKLARVVKHFARALQELYAAFRRVEPRRLLPRCTGCCATTQRRAPSSSPLSELAVLNEDRPTNGRSYMTRAEEATMRTFSFRPALEFRGRKFKGLRGFAGKPFHPPLTDVPVGAYVIAPALSVVALLGRDSSWANDVWRAAGFTLAAGAVVSVATALTGFADWLNTEKGTQMRRMANAHAWSMIVLTLLVLAELGLRYFDDRSVTPDALIAVIDVVIAVLVTIGGTIGGTMVYDFGFNVETATDNHVYHVGEYDIVHPHDDPPPETDQRVAG